jgi:hypothetical protein
MDPRLTFASGWCDQPLDYGRGMDRAHLFATITLADGSMSFQGAYKFEVADQGHLGSTGGTGAYVGSQGKPARGDRRGGKVNLDITLLP